MLEIYVKPNSSCEGLPLFYCEPLSPIVTVASAIIPFPDGAYKVRGWSSLYGGSFVPVSLAKVSYQSQIAILVFGADWGLKLEKRGKFYGMPIIWVEDENDIAPSIRKKMGLN